jgi:hypothetical protein
LLNIIFWHQGDCLQGIHPGRPKSILHTTVTFYSDCVKYAKTSPRTLTTNWLLHHANAVSHGYFFTREFFTKSKMTFVPHPPYLPDLAPAASLFPANLTQLRWYRQNHSQCWTPSQNMTFKMHVKNGWSARKSEYVKKETTSRVMVTSRTKVSFWPYGSTSSGHYEYPLVFCQNVHCVAHNAVLAIFMG